jgi:hypothetical protein
VAGSRQVAFLMCISIPISGCAAIYDVVQDPGALVPVASVLKSLRCEIMTFLVANRFRKDAFLKTYASDFSEAFNKYAYIDLDDQEYGTIQADLKTIDSLGLSIGIDQKSNFGATNQFSKTWHLGPSYNATWTYTRSDVFAVAQNATLGPTAQTGPLIKQLYGAADRQDANFFCYVANKNNHDLDYSLEAIESLSYHDRPDLENFDRIWVIGVGSMTLSKWLEVMAKEFAKNYLAQGPFTESIIPGQLNYSFSLEAKPSLDLKYTLISKLYNPLVPDLTVSKDDISTFSMYLNTPSAKAAYGAKNGNANLPSSPKLWTVHHVSAKPPKEGAAAGAAIGQPSHRGGAQIGVRNRPRLIGPPGQKPGVEFSAPVALPGPPPAGN